ncbi:LysE family transporter [Halolamina sp. R1-12]|uniref:Threonine/homoserine/homoserine lactone efflux protein n=2 Tax=Haloferacaceae TaxID=1644056 RepID=A0A1I5R685_9EURY|nr:MULTISPECIES: LysE family transporter [Halolamina]NHX35706.1 LysE family transporter [Halolamina sp. R1-12]SFP54029.1 Threonine/homoserine/homoserine lactone efflux protein [Halolamina pelagica]
MFEVVPSLVAGAAFGLALAAPPGPMNAVIAEESVLRGWVAGVKAGLGAGLADFVFFLLALAGVVGVVQQYPTLQGVLFGVGGLLMVYFAYGAANSVRATFAPSSVDRRAGTGTDDQGGIDAGGDTSAPADLGESTGFRRAFVLALTNPYQILFWLTVGVGLLDPGRLDVLAVVPYVGDALTGVFVVETGSPALIVGLFGGIALWLACFPAALVQAGRRVDSFAPAVAALSALVLGGFGVSFLLEAWRVLG